MPPPPGVPFHRMDRTALHAWWRPLGALVVLIAMYIVGFVVIRLLWEGYLWAVTGEWALAGERRIDPGPHASAVKALIFFGLLLPVPLLVVRLVSQRPSGTLLSVLGRVRWRWLAVCVIPAAGAAALDLAGTVAATVVVADGPPSLPWKPWGEVRRSLASALPAVVLMTVMLELFRGWVVQAVGAYTLQRADGGHGGTVARVLGGVLRTPWPAVVAGALPHLLLFGARGWEWAIALLYACTCAWLVLRTGGLEATIALQTVGYVTGAGMWIAMGGHWARKAQQAEAWYYMLPMLPALAFFVAVVLWLRRRLDIATVTPG